MTPGAPLAPGRTPLLLALAGTLLKYALGVVAWLVVLGALALYGRVNVWSWVDGLWMRELHDGLVRNAIGEVAYRAEQGYGDYGTGPKYLYTAEYQLPGAASGAESSVAASANKEIRSLTSLVDVATWHEAGSDGANFTLYLDARHKYAVRTTSDGTDMSAADR